MIICAAFIPLSEFAPPRLHLVPISEWNYRENTVNEPIKVWALGKSHQESKSPDVPKLDEMDFYFVKNVLVWIFWDCLLNNDFPPPKYLHVETVWNTSCYQRLGSCVLMVFCLIYKETNKQFGFNLEKEHCQSRWMSFHKTLIKLLTSSWIEDPHLEDKIAYASFMLSKVQIDNLMQSREIGNKH